MEKHDFAVKLTRLDGYKFDVDFMGPTGPDLTLDEPEPLGHNAGPNATRVLAAAVGNCLGASLAFCLNKAKVDLEDLSVTVTGLLEQNEKGRTRIASLAVNLDPTFATDTSNQERCFEIFEDYCIVTQSIRDGIPVDVTINHPTPTPATIG
jgi:uncharacterized OsmC-like protein